ncbi:hypothetical protein ACD591_09820 [Rufibacter glacialis]|uniref:Uncharacterized protein n=1 Tax=Rufibacter glacialis TaxID=1259555 RepID=A0ABV4REM2_9BACT|nr:hypothetical protein [Rufibacter glacialis]GGK80305.1 hypothetical protein GCM10011405_30110 [Rufibacter glacialis]
MTITISLSEEAKAVSNEKFGVEVALCAGKTKDKTAIQEKEEINRFIYGFFTSVGFITQILPTFVPSSQNSLLENYICLS